jgi:hypothetical protein
MPFKKIGKKIFSGKGYSGKKGKIEMLEVKPADRSTKEKRQIGKILTLQSKIKNNLLQGAKERKDATEEILDMTGSYARKARGEDIKPIKKIDDIEKEITNLETGQVEKYAKGGLVKKSIARGCGKVMSNRRKVTKYF